MKLRALLTDLVILEAIGSLDVEVSGIHGDSRRVRKGDIFVAIRGEKLDGHNFIGEAIGAGACVVVGEHIVVDSLLSVTQIRVADGRVALAHLATNFYGRPSESLRVIGITGTNGKTTTSYLLASILEMAGTPTGMVGTIVYRIGNRELPAPNTTPPADDLQELLAQMLHAGMKAVVMEVSSHSLVQHRVKGVAWDAAVFTNLTQDHLDYHKNMEVYFEAKRLLFQQLGCGPKKACAILNLEDPKVESLRQAVKEGVQIVTYGLHASADLWAEAVEHSVAGSRFRLVTHNDRREIVTSLCGAHNVSNCLAAIATASALGLEISVIQKGVESLKNVPGRLERLEIPSNLDTFAVFVDYAHSHDALRNVLRTLRLLTQGRLIVVFGCGGNRDTTKRRLMGQVASEFSDFSILTTDNPRFEEPSAIVQQIVEGFKSRNNYKVVLDRREAIREALTMSKSGDVILLAGKGHETYQEVAGTRSPFDDREVARELLGSLSVEVNSKGATWKN